MDIAKKNRTDLKAYFVKNAIPTESNFADLIDAMLNQKEDGVAKPAGNPLSIEATGDASSLRKAINFYESFGDANPAWSISLNPRINPGDAATAKPGFAISDPTGANRLFIDRSSKNVGIGTVDPRGALDVQANPRTGTHPTNRIMYVTGDSQEADGIEFRHSNGTQGIGFGYNTIYATGSNASQDLKLAPRGDGTVVVTGHLQAGNSDLYFTNPGHNHTGFGNTAGYAAIENDGGQYGALMILGRSGTDQGRKVKLWDYLEVHSGGGAVINIGQFKGIKYSAGDGIRGTPNLWLDAAGTVFIKAGFQSAAMDIAERFQTTGTVEAGDVVVFDENLNAVKICDQPNDGRVVGIASGEPAFILGTNDQEMPIALCGRVPCKVDADITPIKVGDVLITSSTPGHAQRATDTSASAGRILGKALGSLLKGKGEIPVLVFLY